MPREAVNYFIHIRSDEIEAVIHIFRLTLARTVWYRRKDATAMNAAPETRMPPIEYSPANRNSFTARTSCAENEFAR